MAGPDDRRAAMLRRAAGLVSDAAEALLAPLSPWREATAQSRVVWTTGHRPYPLPERRWIQAQTWRDLLFAHWPVDPGSLRAVVPQPLPIDTFEGRAWIAVTPFEVTGLRPRGAWPLPGVSRFAEVNVRTYTTLGERPGIFFFSLDAGSTLAVAGARATYRLPYFRARMAIERAGNAMRYRCERIGSAAGLQADYQPDGTAFEPVPGTLEHFLTERYCLYTVGRGGRVRRAEIHHPPWRLRAAQARIARNTMTAPAGIALPDVAPLLHFSARQDVVIWAPSALD